MGATKMESLAVRHVCVAANAKSAVVRKGSVDADNQHPVSQSPLVDQRRSHADDPLYRSPAPRTAAGTTGEPWFQAPRPAWLSMGERDLIMGPTVGKRRAHLLGS